MNFLQGHIFFFFFLLSHELVFADFFTPEQKAQAVRMVKDGNTAAYVARKFNVSVSSVRNWVHAARQGTNKQAVPQRRQRPSYLTPEGIAEVFEMIEDRDNPSSFKEVGVAFGTTAAEIFRLVRSERERTGEASHLRRGLTFSSEEKSKAVEEVFRGQDIEKVAERFKTHPINVTLWTDIEAKKRRTQNVTPQEQHPTQEENSEVTQVLKEEIEGITMNPPSLIPEVLNDLKTRFEGYLHRGTIFSEKVREEFLTLLKEAEEELSLDEKIRFEVKIEIISHIKDIKEIILPDSCADPLITL